MSSNAVGVNPVGVVVVYNDVDRQRLAGRCLYSSERYGGIREGLEKAMQDLHCLKADLFTTSWSHSKRDEEEIKTFLQSEEMQRFMQANELNVQRDAILWGPRASVLSCVSCFSCLEELHLDRLHFHDDDWGVLTGAMEGLTSLRVLKIEGAVGAENDLIAGLPVLTTCIVRNERLESLTLRNCNFGMSAWTHNIDAQSSAAFSAFSQAVISQCTSLTNLNFNGSKLHPSQLRSLAGTLKASQSPNPLFLHIRGNQLGEEIAEILDDLGSTSRPLLLDITKTMRGEEQITLLTSRLQQPRWWGSLIRFECRDDLGDTFFRELSTLPVRPHLETLVLGKEREHADENGRDRITAAVTQFFEAQTKLTRLDLLGCNMNYADPRLIGAIADHPSLETLKMGCSKRNVTPAPSLDPLIARNSALTDIYVEEWLPYPAELYQFMERNMENKKAER